MPLRFTGIAGRSPGLIAAMLTESDAELVASDAEHWLAEIPKWEAYDREVFDSPDIVGACLFLSLVGDELVGFASYDPRQRPDLGIVGHNCVLPAFRGNGYGTAQIREVLRRFRDMGIRRARVTTCNHPFFVPAQHMYAACGFAETARRPWTGDPTHEAIEYELGFVGD